MRDLFVVVHPEASHHRENRVGGWFDSHLTDRGVQDAGRIADELARRVRDTDGPISVFTSDLARCRETTTPIAGRLGRGPDDVTFLAELREKSYGVGEGQSDTWFRERFVPPPAGGERLEHDERIEGAETMGTFVRRVYAGMEQVERHATHGAGNGASSTTIVVTHGGAATPVIAHYLRLPVDALSYARFRVSPGSITHLREDVYFHNHTLVSLNDLSHLTR